RTLSTSATRPQDISNHHHLSSPNRRLRRIAHGARRPRGLLPAHHGAVVPIESRAGHWQRSDQSESPGGVADSQRHPAFWNKAFRHSFERKQAAAQGDRKSVV